MNRQGQRGGGDGHGGVKAKDPARLLFGDLVGHPVSVRHNKCSLRKKITGVQTSLASHKMKG